MKPSSDSGRSPLSAGKSREQGFLFAANSESVIGRDGAYSIPLSKDRSLWVFGDTLVGTLDSTGRRHIRSMSSSSGLISRHRAGTGGIEGFSHLTGEDGGVRPLIPFLAGESPDEIRIWPLHGYESNGSVVLHYMVVRLFQDRNWPFKFEPLGTGVAQASCSDFVFRRLSSDGSFFFWDALSPCFGAAVWVDRELELVYLYGSLLKDGDHFGYLARLPLGKHQDPKAVDYLVSAEPRWSPRLEDARPVFGGMPTEMSVSQNAYLGAFLAVHSLETTGKIVGRTSPNPWGPWSAPVVLHEPLIPLRNPLVYNGPLVYAGKEHPELSRNGGRFLCLTYVEFEEYWPRRVDVCLRKLRRFSKLLGANPI